jgi:crotonobetainyl-CoA:carnitine CoA-transferase CaiB-like acyl-CoA transferase
MQDRDVRSSEITTEAGGDAADVGLALLGVNVLEVQPLESAQYAGRLLANLGASVSKLEPREGDPLRKVGPFVRRNGAISSVPFEYVNGGKRSIAIDYTSQLGRDVLLRAVDASEIVVTSPDYLPEIVAAANAGVSRGPTIIASCGAESGSVAIPSTEFTRFNGSVSAQLVPLPSKEWRPAMAGRHSFELMSGTGVALAIMASLWELRKTTWSTSPPPIVFVDVSQFAYGVWLEKGVLHRTQRNPVVLRPYTNGYSFGGNLQCQDGRYICLFSLEEHHWHYLAVLIGKKEWLDDERFSDGVRRLQNGEIINAALREWCGSRSAHTAVEECREAGVVVGEVFTPTDLLARSIFRERRFFTGGDSKSSEEFAIGLPTGPGLSQRAVGPAPQLGQDSREFLKGLGFNDNEMDDAEMWGSLG